MFNRIQQILVIVGFTMIYVNAFPEPNSLDECKALVLSGGGSLGAWETGVYYGLTHYGDEEDFHYDVITGISAGSINTAGMVLCPKGTDRACSEWMTGIVNNTLTTDAVWKEWPLGLAEGLLKTGLVNNAPMLESIDAVVSNFTTWERPGSFGSANVETGAYMVYNQTNIGIDEIKYVAKASASIPGFFPYQEFRGVKHIDGGTIVGQDVPSAIDQCLPLVGGDLSKITIDLFSCNNLAPEQISQDGKTLENAMRFRQLHRKAKSDSSIFNYIQAFPEINFRYIIGIGPEFSYSSIDMLNFNPAKTWPFQLQGRQDAKKALERGPGYDAQVIRDQLSL